MFEDNFENQVPIEPEKAEQPIQNIEQADVLSVSPEIEIEQEKETELRLEKVRDTIDSLDDGNVSEAPSSVIEEAREGVGWPAKRYTMIEDFVSPRGSFTDRGMGFTEFKSMTDFFSLHSELDEASLIEQLIEDRRDNEHLESITRLGEEDLSDDEKARVVYIDKKKWPGPLYGPGRAQMDKKIAYVADGFSERTTNNIARHEVGHLKNPEASEWRVVWNENLKPDPLGTLKAGFEFVLNTPNFIRNFFRKCK